MLFPLQFYQHCLCIPSFGQLRHFSLAFPETALKADSVLPAIGKVVSVPVDFICQNAFRIMTRSFEIPLNGCDENITFVISIKRHLFYPGHSLFIKAEIHFSGSEESQVPYGEVFLAFRFYSETVLHTFPQ